MNTIFDCFFVSGLLFFFFWGGGGGFGGGRVGGGVRCGWGWIKTRQ